MPFEKLTPAQLDAAPKTSRSANIGYVDFLRQLRVGQGGHTTTEEEGVSKITIKTRLGRAAEQLGLGIEFLRTPPEEVVFRITGRK